MSTLRQIAHIAGVSHTTVALALRDNPAIKASTRAKVQEIARRLNYTLPDTRPPQTAFGKTIGYIIHEPFGNLATVFLRGAMEEASALRMGVTLMQVPFRREWIEETIQHLLGMRVNGLIIGHAFDGRLSKQSLLACWSSGIHVVQIMNRVFADSIDSVCRREDLYARIAAAHLAGQGHRLVMGCGLRDGQLWTPILREHGIELTHYLDEGFVDDLRRAFDAFLLMNPRPTAMVTAMDDQAYRLINIAREHGISVPGELSILGNGNANPFIYPDVSTIDIQAHEMGKLGMKILIDRIQAGIPPHEITDFQDIVLPAEIIDRGSTGPAPC